MHGAWEGLGAQLTAPPWGAAPGTQVGAAAVGGRWRGGSVQAPRE